jgi:Mg-chelatase subunit ChlD
LLDRQKYNPDAGDGTALYDSVFHVLQHMAVNIAHAYGQNLSTTFTIAVITDGEDNRSSIQPSEIKTIVQELKSKGHLTSSIVFGLQHSKFSPQAISDIKDAMGFDEAIPFGRSDSEIRRAFALASQSAVRSQT